MSRSIFTTLHIDRYDNDFLPFQGIPEIRFLRRPLSIHAAQGRRDRCKTTTETFLLAGFALKKINFSPFQRFPEMFIVHQTVPFVPFPFIVVLRLFSCFCDSHLSRNWSRRMRRSQKVSGEKMKNGFASSRGAFGMWSIKTSPPPSTTSPTSLFSLLNSTFFHSRD